MTSFPVDAGRRWERVRSYLTGTLPDCDVTTESLVSGQAPMIFTWMAHLMAGFACSNGDADASYRKLFGSFKDYYAEHRSRLDDLELSFVFCVEPDLPHLEKFCSEIETDAYFCRKFVVPLAGSLDRSFGRLPFLPLALGAGRLQRPPSAQTYMRQLRGASDAGEVPGGSVPTRCREHCEGLPGRGFDLGRRYWPSGVGGQRQGRRAKTQKNQCVLMR